MADQDDTDEKSGKRALPASASRLREVQAGHDEGRDSAARIRLGDLNYGVRESLIQQEFVCLISARLRPAAGSGISTVTELWPSG
jgi:hypothetical protein